MWHQPEHDAITRKLVVAEIVLLIQARKPPSNRPSKRLHKVPHMAVRIEERLYEESTSYDEYADLSTLSYRVEQLVQHMGRHSSTTNNTNTAMPAGPMDNIGEQSAIGINIQLVKQEQERLLLLRHASRCPHRVEGQCPVTPHCFSIQQLW
ncbi:hypothetical protein EON65_52855, partial [archaeon]